MSNIFILKFIIKRQMSSFFSCFACGSDSNNSTTTPIPITPPKIIPKEDLSTSKINLSHQFEDNKSRSATNTTFITTDSFPISAEDDESYIRKKIEQIRKKDLPERKAMESEFIRQHLSKSAVVYLVEKEWSELYTAFLKNIETKELRSINNSKLVDGKNGLRTDIKEKEDYFIINDRVWKFVQQMYGGGPPLMQDMHFPVVMVSNRKMQMPMIGIANPLNLCYMISTVQCLLSNQHFAFYFLKKMFDDSKKKMLCHAVLHKIAKNVADQTKIDIKELATLFETKFNPYQQHDAHQFFIHLSNLIQDEAKTESSPKPINANNPETAYSHYFKHNRSIIDRLFVGQTETIVECSRCSVKSITYDAFIDIQLEIVDLVLDSCLKKHFDTQKIEDYACEKCNKKTKAYKREIITKTPNYLVLNLKKFTQSGKKIQERVKYPLQINIKQFCRGHYGDSRYVLQSLMVHKGVKATKGHYYCYTHRFKKAWFYASDDLTKEIEQHEVLGRDAYILFYERLK